MNTFKHCCCSDQENRKEKLCSLFEKCILENSELDKMIAQDPDYIEKQEKVIEVENKIIRLLREVLPEKEVYRLINDYTIACTERDNVYRLYDFMTGLQIGKEK